MTRGEKRRRRFSTAIKKSYVSRIDSGELTVKQVSKLCDVGFQTVYKWRNKYSKVYSSEPIRIIDKSELLHFEEAQKEIKELKQLVGELHIQKIAQDALLDIAIRELGEDFEKKVYSMRYK